LGPVAFGEPGLGAQVGQGLAPGVAAPVGQGVVGHDPFDGRDAEGGEGLRGAAEEPGAGVGLLVGVDLGVGQPGVVVDGAVHVVVADSGGGAAGAASVAVAAVDAPAAAVAEPAEFLDVDVDQFTGAVAFVAAHPVAGRPVQPGQPVQAVAGQHGVHGGGRHVQDRGQPPRPELAAGTQLAHPRLLLGRGLVR